MRPLVIPVLPTRDLEATSAFYRSLGFITEEETDDSARTVRHPAGIELRLSASTTFDPASNENETVIRFDSATTVRRLFDGWSSVDGVIEPPADGEGEGRVRDPMGNLLRLVGPVDAPPSFTAMFVDSPPAVHEAGIAFWAAAFGAEPHLLNGPYVGLTGAPIEIELQRVDDTPRFHVDFAADDVDEGVAHFERLGAVRVERVESWWIMRAPTGQLFCVVPR